ncbi:MAG: hypothetical protein ABSF86_23335 [Steroidobacteraceae bacterium]|jgi:hypothetical protein
MTLPDNLRPDAQLRETLLAYLLDTGTASELTDWLWDIGQDTRGSVEEKRQRIRATTKYLTMPAAEFPAQTESYLAPYPSELLADLCEDLGVSAEGTKNDRYRRVMREVHYRERWLARVEKPLAIPSLSAAVVAPYLGWFPVPRTGNYEKQFYPAIYNELQEIFGDVVYEQLPVAHGSTLKIDFHLGDPQGHGVGIEVKMPVSNADVQRSLGQLDQYQRRYGDNLILFILQDFLKPEILSFFIESLKGKGLAVVVR